MTQARTTEYLKELDTAKKIARNAGAIMLEYFESDQQAEIKDDGTPVTIADKRINAMVIDQLKSAFPDDIVIGEEQSTGDYGLGRRWFCDPIDGTKAFTWRVPTAMFSLGLVIDGVPVMGVAHDPFMSKMYWAVTGAGAFCNSTSIRVNQNAIEGSLVAIASDAMEVRHNLPYLDALCEAGARMPVFSGAVYKMMLVAEGRFAGYVESKVNAHDTAAAQVIVQEAGGQITDMSGQPYDYSRRFQGTIVSNGIVHSRLVEIVAS